MKIGLAMKILRIKRKMTQEQVALEAGMATSNVSRIEKGLRQPSQKVLQKLAKALKIKPSVLYDASEQPENDIESFLEEKEKIRRYEEFKATEFPSKDEIQSILNLFSDLTPDNKQLLLKQLKTLHEWQTKTKCK